MLAIRGGAMSEHVFYGEFTSNIKYLNVWLSLFINELAFEDRFP